MRLLCHSAPLKDIVEIALRAQRSNLGASENATVFKKWGTKLSPLSAQQVCNAKIDARGFTKFSTHCSIVTVILLVANATFSLAFDQMKGLSEKTPMIVDRNACEIRLLATLQPDAFGPGWFKQLPGHHAVAWRGGRKSHEALLKTFSSDTEVFEALISLGAKPGNNLTQEVWDERNNPESRAPERRVEGDRVVALVWWEGLKDPLPLSALLHNPSGKDLDLRFGGHKSLIPVWESGCIICMQSCPGAKISNRNCTIRDYVQGKATFTVNDASVPKGKTKAVIIVRPVEAKRFPACR